MGKRMTKGLDIIGDVHGHAAKLEERLTGLGYEPDGAGYRHPDRTAVFVGDLVDRGPQQLRTLEIAKAMVESGAAKIVMGNHEFNALAYEAGLRRVIPDDLFRLCQALETSPATFLAGIPDPSSGPEGGEADGVGPHPNKLRVVM